MIFASKQAINWNTFFENSLCGPVMLSLKQRNNCRSVTTVVSAHMGEQIDVKFPTTTTSFDARIQHAGG